MATPKKSAEQPIPPRPKVIEQSAILQMQPRPEGLEVIDPLIGINVNDTSVTLDEQLRARKERYEKIKATGGGDFRVIHSNMHVPLPREQWQNVDGSRKEGVPTFVTAKPGDIVRLTVDDAFRALEQNLVEELDAKPSRVGKVFSPPKVLQQFGGLPLQPPSTAAESRA